MPEGLHEVRASSAVRDDKRREDFQRRVLGEPQQGKAEESNGETDGRSASVISRNRTVASPKDGEPLRMVARTAEKPRRRCRH